MAADKAPAKETKKSPLATFKQSIKNQTNITNILAEGIKSTNAKVRALAIKLAVRTQDSAFIKKNVTPLISSEKSKKTLRAIATRINRKPLIKKLAELAVKQAAPAAKTEEAKEAPKA